MVAAFWAGGIPAMMSVLAIPSCLAIALAASNLSPLRSITRKPICRNLSTAVFASGLRVSLTAINPVKVPSTATPITVFPSVASFCPCFSAVSLMLTWW